MTRRRASTQGPAVRIERTYEARLRYPMRPLRYSINATLDGCGDHRAVSPDEELHRHHAENLAEADALLCGRVVYQMMEEAWREPAETGVMPDGMAPWTEPFAQTIHATKK